MESGHVCPTVLEVELVNPGVQVVKQLRPDHMSSRSRAIVWKPDHLGRVEDGGHSELVGEARVHLILYKDNVLEPGDRLRNRVKIPTFNDIIKSCYQQHPHGAPLMLVILSPAQVQVIDGASGDGQPIGV